MKANLHEQAARPIRAILPCALEHEMVTAQRLTNTASSGLRRTKVNTGHGLIRSDTPTRASLPLKQDVLWTGPADEHLQGVGRAGETALSMETTTWQHMHPELASKSLAVWGTSVDTSARPTLAQIRRLILKALFKWANVRGNCFKLSQGGQSFHFPRLLCLFGACERERERGEDDNRKPRQVNL